MSVPGLVWVLSAVTRVMSWFWPGGADTLLGPEALRVSLGRSGF
jgi:hypothetical protein